ncbi:MAG: hypothetical protein FJ288_01090 [Planctomycetes bacterium]|nr:hypothetical protein [Planctomycetota bacterium]
MPVATCRTASLSALALAIAIAPWTPAAGAAEVAAQPRADGYHGIWFTLGQRSEHGDKYSGGLGTYTADHIPTAIHVPEVNKTFFVYGGTVPGQRHLLAMISYYDHARGVVPRPVIVHDKQGVDDPHDNPSLALDDRGHLWVFVSGRANLRPGFKYRSVEPHAIDRFEQVASATMAYPQPWFVPGQGFLHCFTKYTRGRELYWETSADGRTWSEAKKLAGFGGHYQVTNVRQGALVTAFNWHPGGNVDKRTNLYFLRTDDLGRTWKTASGQAAAAPLAEVGNAALVRDYAAEGRLVYINDIQFDREGRPVIFYITSGGYKPGPEAGPREWTIARWDGRAWQFHPVATSDHNYDMGSLYVEDDAWRIIGPSGPGPQPWGTGGEMALWISTDSGAAWRKVRDLTARSQFNHSYARRPVRAHPDFYAFWADGNPNEFSPSRLYFTNRAGDHVWRLPAAMTEEFSRPEVAW